jgi:hypothetical protein
MFEIRDNILYFNLFALYSEKISYFQKFWLFKLENYLFNLEIL